MHNVNIYLSRRDKLSKKHIFLKFSGQQRHLKTVDSANFQFYLAVMSLKGKGSTTYLSIGSPYVCSFNLVRQQ